MFSEKGRISFRNSTGVFTEKDWSNDDAGSSEKALANFGPQFSDAGIKRTLRAERISRKQEETMELWDRNIQAVEIRENLSFLPRLQKTE